MPLVKAHVDVLAFIQLRHQFFENADLKVMIHGSVLLKDLADDCALESPHHVGYFLTRSINYS